MMRIFDWLYDWWFFGQRWKALGVLVVVALVGTLAFWQLRPDSGSDGELASVSMADTDEDTDGARSGGAGVTTTTSTTTTTAPTTTTTVARTTTTTAPTTTTTVADEEDDESDGEADDNGEVEGDVEAEADPEVEADVEAEADPEEGDTDEGELVASAPPAPEGSPAYPTSPDGTPLPLLAIFDTETVTLSGQVPSAEAAERLRVLALANSQFPDVEVIDNMVVNPAVPISVGVRVLELNSVRFPTATAEILPEHAQELNRVVDIMNALPNITVLVIGHADQRGDEGRNFAISDERARAVVNYLRFLGISPTRLSSRAAGESDLLSIEEDSTALALNRRTEFIFHGLLVE